MNTIKSVDQLSLVIRDGVYIYGAGRNAVRLHDYIVDSIGVNVRILGFIVTSRDNNPQMVCELPVYELSDFKEINESVLVLHTGSDRREILAHLARKNVKNVFVVTELMVKSNYDNNPLFAEEDKVYQKRSDEDKIADAVVREEIFNILVDQFPYFGATQAYQSLAQIGLKGGRPTLYRIQRYGLNEILDKDMDVLDIGCNMSFIDISISGMVHSVTGIEYEEALVKVAEKVRDYLNIHNCNTWCGDFKIWEKENKANKYDFIFSLAIHDWLEIEYEKYALILWNHLSNGGFILLESHTDVDKGFDKLINYLQTYGMVVLKLEIIEDMPCYPRRFCLLRKANEVL